jgi:hypothetical protein
LLIHNPQIYAIDLISCSTLSKLIRPLIMLSFNSPKPSKGLDALTPLGEEGDEGNTPFPNGQILRHGSAAMRAAVLL